MGGWGEFESRSVIGRPHRAPARKLPLSATRCGRGFRWVSSSACRASQRRLAIPFGALMDDIHREMHGGPFARRPPDCDILRFFHTYQVIRGGSQQRSIMPRLPSAVAAAAAAAITISPPPPPAAAAPLAALFANIPAGSLSPPAAASGAAATPPAPSGHFSDISTSPRAAASGAAAAAAAAAGLCAAAAVPAPRFCRRLTVTTEENRVLKRTLGVLTRTLGCGASYRRVVAAKQDCMKGMWNWSCVTAATSGDAAARPWASCPQ